MSPDLHIAEQAPAIAQGRAWNVSRLGLGTVKFGRNHSVKFPEGDGFALPSDQEIETLLDVALDCGISLIDTAPAYGNAEERLGKLLRGRRRRFFLVTKTGEEFSDGRSSYHFSAEHTRMSVERSLRRLNTDFLDCVLLHCSRDDANVIVHTPALEVLSRLKEQGKIGRFGASTHTIEGGKLAIELSDCAMVTYNTNSTDQRAVIELARAACKAILVKKGLASGHIGPDGAAEHIRFVTHTPGVTNLVVGSIDPEHIRANAGAIAV
jgi:aryl-alcohol dehydrogenase-like predicted oxidoreductase